MKWGQNGKKYFEQIEELRAELEVLKAKKETIDDINGLLEKQIKATGDILENVSC